MINPSERIQIFTNSLDKVREYFVDKTNKDESAEYFKQYFGIEFKPNCNEEKNTSYYEIYWKDRIFKIDDEGDHNETGAMLVLRCSLRGYISVIVYPCHTDDSNRKEESIILYHRLNPRRLQHKSFLLLLWRTFISYSLVTAVEGSPSVLSRIHVGLMHYFCSKRVNGVLERKRVWHDLKILAGVVFAIVSSDLFVYYLPDRADEERIKKLDEQFASQKKQIDSMSVLIDLQKEDKRQIDSLQYYLKLIEKNTQSAMEKTK